MSRPYPPVRIPDDLNLEIEMIRIALAIVAAISFASCQHCSCEDNLFMGTMRMGPVNNSESPHVHDATPAPSTAPSTMPK